MSLRPTIFVLAGVNGAGKSSVGGARLRSLELEYFNPDEAASRIRAAIGCTVEEANSLAWIEGRRRLEIAISSNSSYAFECDELLGWAKAIVAAALKLQQRS